MFLEQRLGSAVDTKESDELDTFFLRGGKVPCRSSDRARGLNGARDEQATSVHPGDGVTQFTPHFPIFKPEK